MPWWQGPCWRRGPSGQGPPPRRLPARESSTVSATPCPTVASDIIPDDWESLTWSRRLTTTRVEDYLQALVARQILASPNR